MSTLDFTATLDFFLIAMHWLLFSVKTDSVIIIEGNGNVVEKGGK